VLLLFHLRKKAGGSLDDDQKGVLKITSVMYLAFYLTPLPVRNHRLDSRRILCIRGKYFIDVEGRSAHGAQPQKAKDAVLIASQLTVNLIPYFPKSESSSGWSAHGGHIHAGIRSTSRREEQN
jgi:metal-dependent amidase/aminoacylase/carboxypeptidase family protein